MIAIAGTHEALAAPFRHTCSQQWQRCLHAAAICAGGGADSAAVRAWVAAHGGSASGGSGGGAFALLKGPGKHGQGLLKDLIKPGPLLRGPAAAAGGTGTDAEP